MEDIIHGHTIVSIHHGVIIVCILLGVTAACTRLMDIMDMVQCTVTTLMTDTLTVDMEAIMDITNLLLQTMPIVLEKELMEQEMLEETLLFITTSLQILPDQRLTFQMVEPLVQ